jgi:putative ABC transport system permease protein
MAIPAAAGATAKVQLPVSVALALPDHRYEDVGAAYVATPELLGRYGIEPNKIGTDTELLTSIPGDLVLLTPTARPKPTHVQHVTFPRFSSAPHALITEHAMTTRGWAPTRRGWLLETTTSLTQSQIKTARSLAAQAGLTIEARSTQDGLATLRNVATLVGTLIALAIVAMTIGLIRGESTRDLRTLTATGADPNTRRALTATTAGTLAFLGVFQGTLGAYAGVTAAYHAKLTQLTPPPLLNLSVIVVGIPLAAATTGWLLAGREPRTFARQALD